MPYPQSIQNLIDSFETLPGVGPKTAERFVFYLLKQQPKVLEDFAKTLNQAAGSITTCDLCGNFTDNSPCQICADPQRDKLTLCIVAHPQEIIAIEQTHEFHGRYFVLGNTLNAIEGVTPQDIRIPELLNKIKRDKIQEVILAFNPNIEGETTMLYLAQTLRPLEIKVTRLARGLPVGADLEYADATTLTDALQGRREI